MPTDYGDVAVTYVGHATVSLTGPDGTVVTLDPWSDVLEDPDPADVIVCTHHHTGHFDPGAIDLLAGADTTLVGTEAVGGRAPPGVETVTIEPGTTVAAGGLEIQGVHAYNTRTQAAMGVADDSYHPKGLCTGVVFDLGGTTFYHAADTDVIEEMAALEGGVDLAFLPAGGIYTMHQRDALEAIELIAPAAVMPIHYDYYGTECDLERFRAAVARETDAEPFVLERTTTFRH